MMNGIKMVMKRYVLYPVIIGFVLLKAMDVLSAFELGRHFIDNGPLNMLENHLNIALPYEVFKYYMAYAAGFSYGTISIIFSVHKMKLGVISLILFYMKAWASLLILAPMAMVWIPIELTILIIGGTFTFKRISGKPNRSEDLRDTDLTEYPTSIA